MEYLASYKAALEKGWSPDTERAQTALDELEKIKLDSQIFVDLLDDPEGKGDPITLADGSQVPRLPGFRRWMWDGEFCGSVGFRWQRGTSALPAHVLGHIGYATVPWKRGQGYAKQALALLLVEVRSFGLSHVELTTDVENEISQKVIMANGGVFIERFQKPESHRPGEGMRFRITLALTIALFLVLSFQANAAGTSPKVDPALCNALVKNTPDANVAYQPGIDVEGNAVAPADLPGSPQIKLPQKINIPLTLNLAKVLNLNTSVYPYNQLGQGTEAQLGTLTVDGDKVTFNGQDLSGAQQDKLAVLCMQPR
jgi:predicted acetyltransferase